MWSSRHPDVVSAFIDVAPTHRRRGIASRLFDVLEELADRSVMWNVEDDEAAQGFLTSHGYAIAVTSVTSRIQTVSALIELERQTHRLPRGIVCRPAATLSSDLVDLYEQVYRECHLWAGRYTPAPESPWIQFAGPGLEVDGAIQVAFEGGRPCGVASLHSGPFAAGADAFLAPTSVLKGSLDERVAILTHLVGSLLAAVIEGGVEWINVEYDSTYADLMKLAESIPSITVSRRHVWMRP